MSNRLPLPAVRKRDRFKTIFKSGSSSKVTTSSSKEESAIAMKDSKTTSSHFRYSVYDGQTETGLSDILTGPTQEDARPVVLTQSLNKTTATTIIEETGSSQEIPDRIDLWEQALSKLSPVEQKAVQSIQATLENGSIPFTERMAELINLTREKQRRCEEKAFKFNFRGQEIILRDVAEKVIVFLNKFKTIGDVVVSFDPTHAALPWAGVRFLLQAATGEQEQMGSLLVATEKITYLTNRCTVYEALYRRETTPQLALNNLHEALISLYAAMLRIIAVAHHLFPKHIVSRAVKALFDPEAVTDLLKACVELESRVDIEAGNCSRICSQEADSKTLEWLESLRQPVSRIDENVLTLLAKMADSERHHILFWTSGVLYGSNHDAVCQERTLRTCGWILERKDFLEWQQSSNSAILWLHGTAGTGKTFLTSKVIDYVQDTLRGNPNHEGFAYFYCNRNETDRRDTLSILRSFVRQLSGTIREKECVQKSLIRLHKACMDKSREPDMADCNSLIREFINFYPRTTIILDALDECDKDKREEMVSFFDEIVVSATRPVKIFISSRPDVDIKDRLRSKSNIEIQATANQNDISLFIETKITKHPRWEEFSLSLRKEIVTVLELRGNGMFQWVHLQIEQLLELRLEREIRERLGKLPNDLEASYREIVDNMSNAHRVYFDRACQWVMSAHQPLRSYSMLRAVSQDPLADTLTSSENDIDEKTLLEYCHNLLIVDSTRKVWIPSHLSVIEFFEAHLWSRQEANYLIGTLTLLAVNNLIPAELPKRQDRRAGFIGRSTIESIGSNSFEEYATEYWMVHAKTYDFEQDKQSGYRFSSLLKQFLGSPSDSSQAYRKWYRNWHSVDRGDVFGPDHIPAFAICAYGLYYPLVDWWDDGPWSDLERSNNSGKSLLVLAVESGCLRACEQLVNWGADANFQYDDWPGSSLAIVAYMNQHTSDRVQIARLLINAGADVDLYITSEWGCGTALMASLASHSESDVEDVEMLKLLIQSGANVNQHLSHNLHRNSRTHGKASPLATAAAAGKTKSVEILLNAGATINCPILIGDHGSALIASVRGGLTIVKQLLNAGADLNMTIEYGKYGSVLHAAFENKDIELMKYLIEAGADIHTLFRTSDHGNILAAAVSVWTYTVGIWSDTVEGIWSEMVELLLRSGANVNMPLLHGEHGNALCAAVHRGKKNLEAVYQLLDAGAEINVPISYGDHGSPLCAAISSHSGGLEMIDFLLKAGAEPNMILHHGRYGNALCAAGDASRSDEIITLLIKAGADVNMTLHHGAYGNTLSFLVGSLNIFGRQRIEAVKLLLKAGADVNPKYGDIDKMWDPLIVARQEGYAQIIQLILDAGAKDTMPPTIPGL